MWKVGKRKPLLNLYFKNVTYYTVYDRLIGVQKKRKEKKTFFVSQHLLSTTVSCLLN